MKSFNYTNIFCNFLNLKEKVYLYHSRRFIFSAYMNLFTDKAVIIITCPKRLAPYLEQEVKDLGFIPEETFVTGVRTVSYTHLTLPTNREV